jgi:uncharacterized Zn-finger protein
LELVEFSPTSRDFPFQVSLVLQSILEVFFEFSFKPLLTSLPSSLHSFCNKSFSQGNDLKAHIRRHTGERFKCDLCSEGFIQGYHLTHHKRTVHGLDVKSHIRRVEKFVTPSTGGQDGEEKQDEEGVKMESEYAQVRFLSNLGLLEFSCSKILRLSLTFEHSSFQYAEISEIAN